MLVSLGETMLLMVSIGELCSGIGVGLRSELIIVVSSDMFGGGWTIFCVVPISSKYRSD